uniref:WAPL domain-containing protein n=1 Tax=Angiostrongylus cantonensis TaxID=6313 RepID=A0A0K0DG88_ANGCA
MNFHDDSHILSKLGSEFAIIFMFRLESLDAHHMSMFQAAYILKVVFSVLASRDECPHKIRSSSSSKAKASSEKDRFVDVSIDGLAELKSDSDEEEPIFDIVSFLCNFFD